MSVWDAHIWDICNCPAEPFPACSAPRDKMTSLHPQYGCPTPCVTQSCLPVPGITPLRNDAKHKVGGGGGTHTRQTCWFFCTAASCQCWHPSRLPTPPTAPSLQHCSPVPYMGTTGWITEVGKCHIIKYEEASISGVLGVVLVPGSTPPRVLPSPGSAPMPAASPQKHSEGLLEAENHSFWGICPPATP